MKVTLICFLAILGAAFAQPKHKVDLYSGAVPRIAAGSKTGDQFNADVNSQSNVNVNAIGANGAKSTWTVGAGSGSAQANGATAQNVGNTDYLATQGGQQSKVHLNGGTSANLTAPGNRQLKVDASQTSETAVDNQGRAWSANNTGNKWTAKDSSNGKTASIDNINDASNIKLTGSDGKQYIASQQNSGATSGSAQIREASGFNSWKADQVGTGTSRGIDKTTVYRNGVPVYSSSVDKDRQAVILTDPTGKVNIAECQVDEYKDNMCPELAFNNQFDTTDEFRIDNKTVKVSLVPTVNSSGQLEYQFPGCFDVSMNMILPPNVQAKQLAAQLAVSMPDGLTFVCPDQYNCLPQTCIYTKLCSSANQRPDPTKNAVSWGFSASDNNACTSQNGRNLPFQARVCPPNATYANDPKYQAFVKQLNLFGSVKSDIQITMKLYVMKTAINTCPDLFINSKLQLVGCRQGTVSYTVKVFGQEFLSAQGALDKLLKGQGLFGSATTVAPAAATTTNWMNKLGNLLANGK